MIWTFLLDLYVDFCDKIFSNTDIVYKYIGIYSFGNTAEFYLI